jgi:phage-related protein
VRSIERREFAKIARRLKLLWQLGRALEMPTVRRIDNGVSEIRSGKYRLYFTIIYDQAVFVAHGEKDTQQRDIERAQRRVRELRQ